MATKGKGGRPLVADRRHTTPPTKAAPPPRRRPPVRRRGVAGFFAGIVAWVWRLFFGIVWRVTAVVALVLFGATWYFHAQLPPVADLLDARAKGSVTLLDRDGQVFAWRGETFGGQIDSGSVSPALRNAVIASEDKRFYRHFGISPRGIVSAIRINLREGRGPLEGNGGSTITQQVAKLLCLGVPYDTTTWKSETEYETDCRRGSVWRKVKEMPYALALEWKYSKPEILTIYLNRAYLGAGARGFEAAAQRYFGKSANEVDAAEGAMLAGLLPAPSYYAPTANLERSRDRASVVIGLMREQGYLDAAEAAEARQYPASLSKAAAAKAGGYFADWVMEEGPDFLTKATTEDVIMRTTLDQRLQAAAEDALKAIFEDRVRDGSKAQAAIVVMSADGAVRAMVGGRATQTAGEFNRATQAKRQTGSSFKPFVYAAALDLGYSPADFVEDAPLTINVRGSGPWSPKNYTEEYLGVVTLTTALKKSSNTAAVRISEAVGRDVVRQVATDFGIDNALADGPALALGVSESTLVEMTGAYAGILNGGSAVTPFGLIDLRLQGESDPLFNQETGIGERVISEKAARELTYMMSEVINSGTGSRARLPDRQAAGKTGTTQAARDAWFIGFTADYVAGVWMGYDDNTPLTGVTGGGLPAQIWQEVMVRVHEGVPVSPLPMEIPAPRKPPVPQTYTEEAPQPVDAATPQPIDVTPRREDPAETVLREVLEILSGN
ncbi:MAG: transglycosylase domain-containing protein [Gemmobacter sp.]